jgi:hypothetical protein
MSMFVKWPPPNVIQAVSDLEARGRDSWRRRKSEVAEGGGTRRPALPRRNARHKIRAALLPLRGANNARLCLSPQDFERIASGALSPHPLVLVRDPSRLRSPLSRINGAPSATRARSSRRTSYSQPRPTCNRAWTRISSPPLASGA